MLANSPLPKKARLKDCKLETPDTDEKRNQTNTYYIGELGSDRPSTIWAFRMMHVQMVRL